MVAEMIIFQNTYFDKKERTEELNSNKTLRTEHGILGNKEVYLSLSAILVEFYI